MSGDPPLCMWPDCPLHRVGNPSRVIHSLSELRTMAVRCALENAKGKVGDAARFLRIGRATLYRYAAAIKVDP